MLLCANIQVRGVYTSDNVYDHVTLPSDMRFKIAFDINKWEDHFDFISIPSNNGSRTHKSVTSTNKHATKSGKAGISTISDANEEEK